MQASFGGFCYHLFQPDVATIESSLYRRLLMKTSSDKSSPSIHNRVQLDFPRFHAMRQHAARMRRVWSRSALLSLALLVLNLVSARADVVWRQDFESVPTDWTWDGVVWQIGVPTAANGPAPHAGSRVAGTVLNGSYPDNVNAYLISPWFLVPAQSQQPRLRFWSWHDTASANDYGQLWIRTESGLVTNLTERLVEHTGGAWMQRIVDLSAYAGQTVKLGLQFVSDTFSDPYAGWYVDDVSVETGHLTIDLLNNSEGFESG